MANYNDEKRELLKLKQGLIEESELIPDEVAEKPVELHGFARVKNEVYHLGWAIPVIIGAIALVVFIIVQLASRPKVDLHILIVAASENSELFKFSDNGDEVQAAFEKRCADYDGNGKVYADITFVDLSGTNSYNQYRDVQYEIFNNATKYNNTMLILSDPELLDTINEAYGNSFSAFIDFSDELSEDRLFSGCGARISGTEFARDIGCENSVLFVLDELGNGKSKNTAQYRDRAVEVLKNIVSEKQNDNK